MGEEIIDRDETEEAELDAAVSESEGAENVEGAADDAKENVNEKEAETDRDKDKDKEKDKDKDKESRKDRKKAGAERAKLEAKTAELEKAIAEEKDKYARLLAEYDNYRKRTARELDGRYTDAKADVWKNLLAVVDNFERALAAEPPEEGAEKDPFREGIELTYRQLKEQMEKAGVTEIEAKGAEFNPELHNAVMHCEDETLGENVVTDVFMKGYKIGDKVLRHSMVKVAN